MDYVTVGNALVRGQKYNIDEQGQWHPVDEWSPIVEPVEPAAE